MAVVRFLDPSNRTDIGKGVTLLQAARRSGAPVGSTCGGACACSGCHVFIDSGAEHLSEMDDDEEAILSSASGTDHRSRLACQAFVVGDGTVSVRLSSETRAVFEEHHARTG